MKKFIWLLVVVSGTAAQAGGGGLEEIITETPTAKPPAERSFLLEDNQPTEQEYKNLINKNIQHIRSKYPNDGSIQHNIQIEIGDLKPAKPAAAQEGGVMPGPSEENLPETAPSEQRPSALGTDPALIRILSAIVPRGEINVSRTIRITGQSSFA